MTAVKSPLLVKAAGECAAGSALQVRVHSREGSIKPVTDVVLDRDGAEWPPRLSARDRAEIMRPEALRSERQLHEEPVQGAPGRHLLVSACTRVVFRPRRPSL